MTLSSTQRFAAAKRREKRKQRKRERVDVTATAFKVHKRNGEAFLHVDLRTENLISLTERSRHHRDQRSRRRSRRHDRRLAVAIEDEHFSAIDLLSFE
jgi:hypothetical protein